MTRMLSIFLLLGSVFHSVFVVAQHQPGSCVLMGNSIFEGWSKADPDFFSANQLVNKGISGETSKQMLNRFDPDVISLNPAAVVILAGTNDIAGNGGRVSVDEIASNISTMVQKAKQHHIQVYVCAVLPVTRYKWAPLIQPANSIDSLNRMLKQLTLKEKIPFVDFYTPLAGKQRTFLNKYTKDGVHPNSMGYAVMKKVLQLSLLPK